MKRDPLFHEHTRTRTRRKPHLRWRAFLKASGVRRCWIRHAASIARKMGAGVSGIVIDHANLKATVHYRIRRA